ncbi:amino acid adenylation domain-containing protein [Polynucleobacter sp. AP-Feld-500C-C5]|uniref:amino acid adenylation domain-containing protein n=1 Tax=Polynucleobacter sp. AP-Feld-500C-C5 TaxID=2576924 RepID=UPI001C0C2C39|nr:amino acid adenylation domain-containing protein [Polynucleobacter sp. AP-Feld-500C-C5]MBU3633162.1 amino acid adenylation domain-containing protein [Polynucleobacter sp. AP-Feld-500C-C5]
MAYQIHAIDFFLKSVAKFPQEYVIHEHDRSYTYIELHKRAQEIAALLLSLHLQPLHPIVIALPKCFDAIASIIATQLVGHIYVPVDINSPPARIETILNIIGNHTIITSNDISDKFYFLKSNFHVVNIDLKPENSFIPPLNFRPSTVDIDPLYIMFTSGSTGAPKGVTISNRSVIDYIEWALETFPVSSSDITMSQAPLYFDNSTLDLYLTWATGSSLFIPSDHIYSFPVEVLEEMKARNVTTIFWVPSVLTHLANSDLLDSIKVDSLRNILFAGETAPVKQINKWIKCYPNCLFANLYGPTEITVDCTAYIMNGPYRGTSLPIGYACKNTKIYVLSEDDEICEPDQIGELCVSGSSLALGYWNDPDKTNQLFTQNPSHNMYRDLIYRTGDLVKRDADGLITFIGRKDSQIKHMGYRIELGEIEAVVTQHPQIASAGVVYLPQDKIIACAIVLKTNEKIEMLSIRKYLSSRLPTYMIPKSIQVISNLPLNANGKVDRNTLNHIIKNKI